MNEFVNRYLKKPRIVLEAAQAQQGQKLWLEILIFIAVYMVVSMAISPVMMIGLIAVMLVNPDMIQAVRAGEAKSIAMVMEQVISSETYIVIMLFSEIVMIVIVILFAKLLQKRSANTLGYVKKGMAKEYLAGMVFGFVLFSAAILICVLTGALKITGFSAHIPVMLITAYFLGYLIQGMAEEVLCRGYFMVSVARGHSMVTAILANSIAFAALHLANDCISVLAFINLILFGVFASVYFVKRGNIWGVAALHSVWNFVQGNFYGIQVSGMSLSSSVFKSELTSGAGFINGGTFGLEGGIAVTVCLLIATAAMLFCPQKDAAEK